MLLDFVKDLTRAAISVDASEWTLRPNYLPAGCTFSPAAAANEIIGSSDIRGENALKIAIPAGNALALSIEIVLMEGSLYE